MKDLDAHQARSRRWAEQMLTSRTTLFLGVESTGYHRQAELVAIAGVNGVGQPLFYSLVKPSSTITSAATALHGLDQDAVAHAPAFSDIVPTLLPMLQDAHLVGYNLAFVLRILRQTLPDAPWGQIEADCLMHRYASYRGDTLSTGKGLRRYSLADACQHMRVPLDSRQLVQRCQAMLGIVQRMALPGPTMIAFESPAPLSVVA